MKIRVVLLIVASILSFPAFASNSMKSDNDQLLVASCQDFIMKPEQESAKACVYFIEGFLAAARTIDPPVENSRSDKKRKTYGLMSRPHPNWARTPVKRFFPFCVPDDLSKAHVIKTISKQLSSLFETKEMLNKKILKVLNSEYSCRSTYQD